MISSRMISSVLALALLPSLHSQPYQDLTHSLLGSGRNSEPETAIHKVLKICHINSKSSRGTTVGISGVAQEAQNPYKKIRQIGTETDQPASALAGSWMEYYRIAARVYLAEGKPELKNLVLAVLKLKSDFDQYQYSAVAINDIIRPVICLAHRALEEDNLLDKERLWAIGILSCLKYQIPEEGNPLASRILQLHDLARPRGDLELHLLKDWKLYWPVRYMWSPVVPDILYHDLREALERVPLTISIFKTQDTNQATFFKTMETLVKFLNMGSPIKDNQASELMNELIENLGQDSNQHHSGFSSIESETNLRLLFHMERFHPESRSRIEKAVQQRYFCEEIRRADLKLQLENEATHPQVKFFLGKIVHNDRETEKFPSEMAVEVLTSDKIPLNDRGNLFRVINWTYILNPDENLLGEKPITKTKSMRILNTLDTFYSGPLQTTSKDLKKLILEKYRFQS